MSQVDESLDRSSWWQDLGDCQEVRGEKKLETWSKAVEERRSRLDWSSWWEDAGRVKKKKSRTWSQCEGNGRHCPISEDPTGPENLSCGALGQPQASYLLTSFRLRECEGVKLDIYYFWIVLHFILTETKSNWYYCSMVGIIHASVCCGWEGLTDNSRVIWKMILCMTLHATLVQ